jgi:hypothetical protein
MAIKLDGTKTPLLPDLIKALPSVDRELLQEHVPTLFGVDDKFLQQNEEIVVASRTARIPQKMG